MDFNINSFKYEDGQVLEVGDLVEYTSIGSGGWLSQKEGIIEGQVTSFGQIKMNNGHFYHCRYKRNESDQPLDYDDGDYFEVKRMSLKLITKRSKA